MSMYKNVPLSQVCDTVGNSGSNRGNRKTCKKYAS
jgi:hypothetical protein